MVEHNLLTGAALHEPKGCASAGADKVYVANGAGSGTWLKAYTMGWEDIHDSVTSGSPIALTVADTFYDLTNSGLGVNSVSTYRLPEATAIWDTGTNEFDLSGAGLAIGDTVDIRFDLVFTTSGANHDIEFGLDVSHGTVDEFYLPVYKTNFKAAAAHQVVVSYPFYIGSASVLNNPIKVVAKSDSTGDTVIVNGWFVRSIPVNPRYQ